MTFQNKGVHVGSSGGGGGAASSIVIGNPVTGGGANRVLYEDASQNLAASANFGFDGTTVSLASASPLRWSTDAYVTRYAAKQLMISGDGTGATTSAGIIVGYEGTSGHSAIWPSAGAAPTTSNYAIRFYGSSGTPNDLSVQLNAGSSGQAGIAIGNSTRFALANSALGWGPSITAGTATTNAPRALSISQGWTDGTTGNIGIVGNFDMGATGTATGKLLSLQAGADGTTEVLSVSQAGVLQLITNTPSTAILRFGTANTGLAHSSGGDNPVMMSAGNDIATWTNGFLRASSAIHIGWSSGASGSTGMDTSFMRIAAGIAGVRNGSTGGAALSMVEQTAPSAPAANGVYIYAQDNGAGKTQLMALFNSGAAQQIAIEP